MEKLWGDNYFDQKGKKWKNHSKPDEAGEIFFIDNLPAIFCDQF